MKDSGTNGKAIKIAPEELIFDQVIVNQAYTQVVSMKNSLSAPVDLVSIIKFIQIQFQILKTSSGERLEIEPKVKKLAPYESFEAEITLRLSKALPSKTKQQKETIYIKSDFFDQKINVIIIPAMNQLTSSTTPRDNSLQSSMRLGGVSNNLQKSTRRDSSRDQILQKPKDYSPLRQRSQQISSVVTDLEKELELKQNQIIELSTQVKKQEIDIQNAYSQLKQEVLRKKELEEGSSALGGLQQSNKDYLDKVRVLLKEREPNLEQLMDLTLRKERDYQERKDAKILEILKVKDKQIEELQQRTIAQETEYGKLAQAYQECKRKYKLADEEVEKQGVQIKSLLTDIDTMQERLQAFEKNQDYMRISEMEEQLIQQQDIIQNLEYQNNEKGQNEAYFLEAIDRLKEQLNQKEQNFIHLEREFQDEKQKRLREEEHSKTLMQQITQINQDQINERSEALQQLKTDKEVINKISKLQEEKNELLQLFDQVKRDSYKEQDQLRFIHERLISLRGFSSYLSSNGQESQLPIIDQLERKVEDLARVFKEMEQDNLEMSQKIQKQNEQLQSREKELQMVIEENEEIVQKINTKKKNIHIQTTLAYEEMDDKLTRFDKLSSKIISLEDENERLLKELEKQQQKSNHYQRELDKQSQEFNVFVKQQNNRSITMSDMTPTKVDQQEELISKLNAKITSLKLNEEKLQEQLSMLKSVDHQSVYESSEQKFESTSKFNQNQAFCNQEEKLNEYEHIVLEQRDKLLKLEEFNYELQSKLKEVQMNKGNEIQLLHQRIQSLSDINQKLENLCKRENNYEMLSSKSTACESEKMRQYNQQLEINLMNLKHTIDSLKTEKEQKSQECQILKDELDRKEREYIRMKADLSVAKVIEGQDNSKLLQKIQEQKNQIRQLESIIQQTNNQDNHKFSEDGWSGKRLEDILKTNEKLRKDHQQALLIVEDLKENFANNLNSINDTYEIQRQKMLSENISLQKKVEQLNQSIQYMEKKELRLFGQLEESKLINQQETEEKERRTKELEELLFKKEEAINDLEREIKQKERILQERQEQISVLIGTLENEHSTDENRQKVLNLSAELCSLKAIEAQQERKINELNRNIKSSESTSQKYKKLLEQEKIKNKDLQQNIQNLEKECEELSIKKQEFELQKDEKDRECNELQYKFEREEFQLQLKEETISQLRDHIKRSEQTFKEEIERIRKEHLSDNHSIIHSKRTQSAEFINKTISFKASLNSLHLILADFLSKSKSNQEKIVIQELEKSLGIASQTIEQLQQDLDKERTILTKIHCEFKAQRLSKILLLKNQSLNEKIQRIQMIYSTRDEERSKANKYNNSLQNKIITDQERKINQQEKEISEITDQNYILKQENLALKDSKDELESNLICFQQELENQKLGMERKAELTVDERYKSKNEYVRTYFDSNITRILLNQNSSNEKILDLGREICSLKILQKNLEQRIQCEQTEKECQEVIIQNYKEQVQQLEQKIRSQSVSLITALSKTQKIELSNKQDQERKKQEKLQLEKELLKSKQIIEEKAREIIVLNEKFNKDVSNTTAQTLQKQIKQNDEIEKAEIESKLNQAQEEISDLQTRLMELRNQHLLELEDIKLQYDIEIAEAKREIQLDREQLEAMYKPGFSPGDMFDQNQALQAKVQDLRLTNDRITQENVILRKKLENYQYSQQSQRNEIEAHRNALAELESTMMEISSQNYYKEPIRPKIEETKKKSVRIKDKNKNLQFNRETQNSQIEEDGAYSQSKIMQDSSLNVSAFTSVMNPRQSLQVQSQMMSNKQFIINPPQIVKSLIQAKLAEMIAKKKIEEQNEIEIQLRNQIKELTHRIRESDKQLSHYKQKNSSQLDIDIEQDELKTKILELELENEDLKIQRASEHSQILQQQTQSTSYYKQQENIMMGQEYPIQDYHLLVESVLSLSVQLAQIEISLNRQEQDQSIEESQRIVIKMLLQKLNGERKIQEIQYAPQSEQDRKVWYLELLESQVDQSDAIVSALQNFIKKLSIDISGNLQSAASIKAASMDLAQNTKKTSEEIKLLRHIAGLIKHDLQGMVPKQNTGQRTLGKTINPFQEAVPQSTIQYDNMVQNNELQNQLTITEKVKKSLETEIVNLKMMHAQELQELKQKLQQTIDQRNSLLQTNEELHERVQNLEKHLDTMKQEIGNLSKDNKDTIKNLLEKEKEKDNLAKTKAATSKHLQKLQQDLHELRKQTDENMKIKERQIGELQSQNSALNQDKERLKAENQMLRRNEKDRKANENDSLKRYENENKDLQERINIEQEERRREMEYWITERATMREMIDQLESERVEAVCKQDDQITGEQVKQIKKKTLKKVKQKQAELKTKDRIIQELKNELNTAKLQITQLDQKIRESNTRCSEAEDKAKYINQKYREIELEKDLILAQKTNALASNDIQAEQIQQELNGLREVFVKLKIEKENLQYEIESSYQKEKEWRVAVEKMNEEIQGLERQLLARERDQTNQIRHLEQKNTSLLQDLKFFKQENDKIKQRIREDEQQMLEYERKLHIEEMKENEIKQSSDELAKQVNESKLYLKSKDQNIQDLQNQILLNESTKMKEIQALRDKLDEVKEANAQIIALYENQLEIIKQKMVKEQKKTDQQSDQMFSLAQREAVIKQLKKEVTQSKSQLSKSKAKNKELKALLQNQENNGLPQNQAKSRFKQQKSNLQVEEQVLDKNIIKLAQIMSQEDGFKTLNEQLQNASQQYLRIAEIETQLAKSENWNLVLSQQLQDQQKATEEFQRQMEQMKQSQLKESKNQKKDNNISEISQQQKQDMKALQQELKSIKADWIAPQEAKQLQDQVKDLSNQLKAVKEEVSRKRDVISQMKLQREQTEVEANQIISDMEGLKDDNIKLQKLIKENNKNSLAVKELKSTNDYLKAQDRRYREEIAQMTEKIRAMKQDIGRKDQIIKDLKDRLDMISEEINQSKEQQTDVEKYRELIKKHKLEVEIKDNQVRTLKQRLEHTEEELDQLKQSSIQNQSSSMQIGQNDKLMKAKVKKYENHLKKSLEALRKIGKELAHQSTKINYKSKAKQDNPLQMSELDREIYKDSVNILGVSMDELEEFMNPSQQSNISHNLSKEDQTFIAKLDKALDIPNSLNTDIDQICDYCVKLISELN